MQRSRYFEGSASDAPDKGSNMPVLVGSLPAAPPPLLGAFLAPGQNAPTCVLAFSLFGLRRRIMLPSADDAARTALDTEGMRLVLGYASRFTIGLLGYFGLDRLPSRSSAGFR